MAERVEVVVVEGNVLREGDKVLLRFPQGFQMDEDTLEAIGAIGSDWGVKFAVFTELVEMVVVRNEAGD